MNTRYRVRYHRKAEQDLVDIYALIAGYTGKQAAQRKLREIETVVRALAAFPYSGSIRADFPDNFRVVPAAEKAVLASPFTKTSRPSSCGTSVMRAQTGWPPFKNA